MENNLDLIIQEYKNNFTSIEREFTIENYQRIDDLYKLPDHLIKYAEQCGFGIAENFLEFFVSKQNHKYLKSLFLNVIDGNTPLGEWGKFPYIIPETIFSDIFTKTYAELYWFNNEDFTIIFKPLYSDWVNFSVKVGCPIMVDKIGDYRSIRINGTSNFSFKYSVVPIINNPQSRIVAFRRWIAQRAASHLNRHKKLDVFNNLDDLSHVVPVSSWTDDAKIAIIGLLREKNEIGWIEGEIPGFVGPDEFYL